MRELPGGRTRFIIKEEKTGVVCDMLSFDADGVLEPDSAAIESDSTPLVEAAAAVK